MSEDTATDAATTPTEGTQTLFRFTAEGVDLEFAGSESFVEKQLQRFRRFLDSSIGGGAPAEEPAAASHAPVPGAPTLEQFFRERPVREKRGAIQDRILLSIYYLQFVQGKSDVSGNDILWCFQSLGIETPKNLHNTLGNLKRKIGHLEEGTRRGLYHLSAAGRQYIEGRFRGL
jgi:hypothetical protein